VRSVADVLFDSGPARTLKAGLTVMLDRTRDELPAIQQLWPRFERLVGLRGRRMYAMVYTGAGTYAACTPIRDGDEPARLGLDTAARPCGHSRRWRLRSTPIVLSWSTTGATTRSNCGSLSCRRTHRVTVECYQCSFGPK
jgi:hypothetical protein